MCVPVYVHMLKMLRVARILVYWVSKEYQVSLNLVVVA